MRHPGAIGLALLVVVRVFFGSVPLIAQSSNGWIGQRVFTKPGTVLKIGKVIVDDEKREESPSEGERRSHRVYFVEKINGPWLWLVAENEGVSGWVKAEQVIPFGQAIVYFSSEIDTNPSSAAYVNRGSTWNLKSEFDMAINDFNNAIRLDPRNEVAFLGRGNAWSRKNELDKALADYNEAIRLDPNYALVYGNRGGAWYRKNELDKALADYNEAIRLNPKYTVAYYGRGSIWFRKNGVDKALADYNEIIRLNPKFASAYFSRGYAYLITSRDGADSDARTYLGFQGWRDEYSLSAILIGHFGYRRKHRDAEARQILDEAASQADTSVWPYPVIRYLRREVDEKALLAAATDNERMPEAQVYLGLDLALSGHPEEALPHLRWVKENGKPNFLAYNLALAEIDRIEGRKTVSTRP